jgi:hypothetical protein
MSAAAPQAASTAAGFGSFHSGDVEVLIRQPDGEYAAPPPPFDPPLPLLLSFGGGAAASSAAAAASAPSSAAAGAPSISEAASASAAPAAAAAAAAAHLAAQPFGAAARGQFLIDFDRWTFVNHGAFGGTLAAVADDAERWRRHCERQPLLFLDRCAGIPNVLVHAYSM